MLKRITPERRRCDSGEFRPGESLSKLPTRRWFALATRRNRAQARVLASEDKQLKNLENHAKTDQKSVEQEIKDLKGKLAAYPKADQYVLDCFALDMHSEHQKMPVYDYGRPWK